MFFAALFMLQDLLRKLFIGRRHITARLKGKNAGTLGAHFRRLDAPWDFRVKHMDALAVCLPHQCADLLGEVGAALHHRNEDAGDLKIGVKLALHLAHGL
ncbi:hypothetical protein SDC9_203219 [bioreactor metagenome]|uniref:Uncharacterized protein n=1 Tax=bioreactor metagenome TaxID=1076179 RepID=A0A645IVU3_9ZZZZ